MNEPREPLSPSVYRRRRVVAMAGLGVGAVLFVWAVGALLGGGDSTPQVRGAADVGPGRVPAPTSAPVSDPPSSGPLPGSPSGSASATTSPVTSVAPTESSVPRPTTTTTPPTTTTPVAPTACPDSVLRVTVTTDRPSYPVGSEPVFTLRVTNAGHVPCVRDVSHQLRSIEVLRAGGKQVWASNDCYSPHTNEVHALAAGESLSYSVRWAGRTAAPGCPAHRTTVPAGSYRVIGKLGDLASSPVPLLLTD